MGFAALAAESPAWLPDLLGKPTVPASSRWPGSLALETLTSSCKAHAFSRLLAAMAPTPTGSLAFPSPVKSIPNNKVIETPWVLFPYSTLADSETSQRRAYFKNIFIYLHGLLGLL